MRNQGSKIPMNSGSEYIMSWFQFWPLDLKPP